MGLQEIQLPHNHQVAMNRFITACQVDERVVAAFLGGSNAKGMADAYSDLDLYLITSDAGKRPLSACWASHRSWKTLGDLTRGTTFFPMVQKVNFGLVARATSITFMLGRTESCLIKRTSCRTQFFLTTRLTKPSRSRRYVNRSPGSGMNCPTSSRPWDVGN